MMSDSKRLLIISHTPHYWRQKELVGWGPTVREIDALSRLFTEIVHLAPIYSEVPPPSALPYQSPKVTLRKVMPAGGRTLREKLGVFKKIPGYWYAIQDEIKQADVVHVRCPANISLVAILWLAVAQQPVPRWVKYAGNWQPNGRDHPSYAFQRWWLKKGFHQGVVTVNGRWPNQPGHIYSFYNPSLTQKDIEEGRKLASLKKFQPPINLLYVGRVEEEKGTGRAIQICQRLHQKGVPCCLHIIGDGPQAGTYRLAVKENAMSSIIQFHGWKTRDDITEFYAAADFLLLPSAASEGWPKVLSEGIAYGAVPIVGAVSSIPQFLNEFGTGVAIPPHNIPQFVEAILEYFQEPSRWLIQSQTGLKAAGKFTYSSYLKDVCDLFDNAWQIKLSSERANEETVNQ